MARSTVVTHSSRTGRYQVWAWDPAHPDGPLLHLGDDEVDEGYQLTRVAGYYLLYKPPEEAGGYVDYMLVDGFNPYPAPLGELKQTGNWYWDKFTGSYDYTDSPGGAEVVGLQLTGITGYVLSQLPTTGRRSFTLWNFDGYPEQPGRSIDPIAQSMADSSSFPTIGFGEQLIGVTDYVLVIDDTANTWRVFSFDPQQPDPLVEPVIASGTLPDGLSTATVSAVGDRIVAITDDSVLEFRFTPTNPFTDPSVHERHERLVTDASTVLVAGPPPREVVTDAEPGTLPFMQEKIEHVVYYVLESRSFDNVLGWLYDAQTAAEINWVGATGATFEGASPDHTNQDGDQTYPQSKYADGATTTVKLDVPLVDPFHGTPDAIQQQWSSGYASYQAGDAADMGGFVRVNGSAEVMLTYTPTQLAVLNGLASSFAVSDLWFCSEAGGTTTNRATLATGSALGITTSYEGGDAYTSFSKRARRQSLWKVLTNYTITDWVIYHSVLWEDEPYTYHLWVEGQLPSVDAYPGAFSQPVQSFYDAIENGDLPKFSFIEPVWYDPDGSFTSYHPSADVLPGEAALKKIYDAISQSPTYRENTVLVISFSKGGGIYDHVPAQRLKRAWPHDSNAGYGFDVTGTRVPTIVVSPYVREHTVFRSDTGVPYDGTSLAATLLAWFGIPRSGWGMGDRIAEAPTFEGVFQLATPRTDVPTVTRAADETYPAGTPIEVASPPPVPNTWATSGTGQWPSKGNWVDTHTLPTSTATFGASSQTSVGFAYVDPQAVETVHFTSEAPAFTFLLDEEQPTAPMLTLTGRGVVNDSTSTQTFAVQATSTATTQAQLAFLNTASASAGTGPVAYIVGPTTSASQSGGIIVFHQRSTAGSASFEVSVGSRPPQGYATVGAEVRFVDDSNAGTASFHITGTTGPDADTFGNVVFHGRATADHATFTNAGGTVGDGGNTQFYECTTAAYATIDNRGGKGGNGGDVAFDGTATASNATITNHAADHGYGGVTSFNNNPPWMSSYTGASAGHAVITNKGASGDQSGSGGHTELTGIYGSGTAADARIVNEGASNTKNANGGGYTLFAYNGRWPYCTPTAGRATITNQPAGIAGGCAGNTRFKYQNWDDDGYEDNPGPTAANATITNEGASIAGADGGYTVFDNRSTAGSATLVNQPGTVVGAGGGTTTFKGSASADSASIAASGGVGEPGTIVFEGSSSAVYAKITLSGGGELDISGHDGSLTVGELNVDQGTIRCEATQGALIVENALAVTGPSTFAFTDTTAPTTPQTLIQSADLGSIDVGLFAGNDVGGLAPTFSVSGDLLQVTFG